MTLSREARAQSEPSHGNNGHDRRAVRGTPGGHGAHAREQFEAGFSALLFMSISLPFS
jgi:hypothetical protein